MGDIVGLLVVAFLDVFVLSGPTAERRTNEAYRDAWKSRRRGGNDSVDVLRASFKQHSAPGAYVDPDGEALRPWLAAWRSGLAPRQAGRAVKKFRKSEKP